MRNRCTAPASCWRPAPIPPFGLASRSILHLKIKRTLQYLSQQASSRTGHRAAGLGAAPARLRAALAMLHLMLRALVAAGRADLRAERADRCSELTTACHVRGSKPTNGCTVHVERDTARHHLDILLAKAGGGACIARCRARVTGIDAILNIIVCHGFSRFPGSTDITVQRGRPAPAQRLAVRCPSSSLRNLASGRRTFRRDK